MGFLVEGGGKHAEVAAGGALVAEEGVAGVEGDSPFGLGLGFAAIGWVYGFGSEGGEEGSWGFKGKKIKHGGIHPRIWLLGFRF